MLIGTMLLIASFVVFVLAAVGVPSGRVNLIAVGLALYVAVALFGLTLR